MLKKHIFQILYIIVVPLCPASLKHRFLQSPSFQQVQSALIGQLTQCIVIGRTPQAHIGNVTPLTIIVSFSFQVSFISSSPRGKQSCVTGSVDARICSTQAAVKTISDGLYTLQWCDPVPSHTHTQLTHMTHYAQNSAFEQSIANTWTNNKTYLRSSIKCVAQIRTFGLCCCVVNKS